MDTCARNGVYDEALNLQVGLVQCQLITYSIMCTLYIDIASPVDVSLIDIRAFIYASKSSVANSTIQCDSYL